MWTNRILSWFCQSLSNKVDDHRPIQRNVVHMSLFQNKATHFTLDSVEPKQRYLDSFLHLLVCYDDVCRILLLFALCCTSGGINVENTRHVDSGSVNQGPSLLL